MKVLSSPQSICIVSDSFPPERTSAAVQMWDLAVELSERGHRVYVITPSQETHKRCDIETVDGVTIVRVFSTSHRGLNYLKRSVSEFFLPFRMLFALRSSVMREISWDLLVWYSPTIFFGPLVWWFKKRYRCRTYLILRDIFPQWAVDLGLMRRGIPYYFFKMVASFQYSLADSIGVQSRSNVGFLTRRTKKNSKSIEILHNWQTPRPNVGAAININTTILKDRKIAIFIGNIGVAQDVGVLIQLADIFRHDKHVGFVFVGRGSEFNIMKKKSENLGLHNILFFDEIDPKDIPGLLAQCHVGLISLDTKHKTHNMPGKLITYTIAGLPILARVNPRSDLISLIKEENIGFATCDESAESLIPCLGLLLSDDLLYERMSKNSRNLSVRLFSTRTAAMQILGP